MDAQTQSQPDDRAVSDASADPLAAASSGDGLRASNLAKSFKGRQVVKDVSLQLRRGEIAGLLGPNGAGKTTCFYMVMGLIHADAGRVTIDNEDVTGLPMYQRARLGVGYLPQESSIFRGMTVYENVMAVAELTENTGPKRRQLTNSLLEELQIAHLAQQNANSLSGGERRRVEIARALACRPSFMLLDEPFTGIDPLAVSDISDLVRYLKGRGLGVLITDHQVRETLQIVDRASIIYDGKVLFEGRPDAVLSNEDVRRVYLGDRFNA
ncbi:MAG: LPS export ABC transporter ATP-binding protein [Alphaproteobacteria bacterium]|nr:LPS export ABC transporter ATP-binding protein [Alphaproteobacteria bacterium]